MVLASRRYWAVQRAGGAPRRRETLGLVLNKLSAHGFGRETVRSEPIGASTCPWPRRGTARRTFYPTIAGQNVLSSAPANDRALRRSLARNNEAHQFVIATRRAPRARRSVSRARHFAEDLRRSSRSQNRGLLDGVTRRSSAKVVESALKARKHRPCSCSICGPARIERKSHAGDVFLYASTIGENRARTGADAPERGRAGRSIIENHVSDLCTGSEAAKSCPPYAPCVMQPSARAFTRSNARSAGLRAARSAAVPTSSRARSRTSSCMRPRTRSIMRAPRSATCSPRRSRAFITSRRNDELLRANGHGLAARIHEPSISAKPRKLA